MSAPKYDRTAARRRLETAYPGLHTATGVKALLRDWRHLRDKARDKGDYDALVMAIDLETALAVAQLTDKQQEVLRAVYVDDMTQEDAAVELGKTQQYVDKTAQSVAKKIATIYGEWGAHDGV